MNKTTIKSIAIIVAFTLVLGGCSIFPKTWPTTKILPKTKPQAKTELPKNIGEQLDAQTKIKKFTDYDELKEFLEQGADMQSYGNSCGLRGDMGDIDIMTETTADFGINAPMATKSMDAGQAIPSIPFI
ncbi:hypothetical protein KAJ61_04680 [Candidatus Parcubacteria bacterium]|nr:hypothetical protein [Candidatus Parcubacteria bacterium]